VSGHKNGSLCFWDFRSDSKNKAPTHSKDVFSSDIYSLAISGNTIICSSFDEIKSLDFRKLESIGKLS